MSVRIACFLFLVGFVVAPIGDYFHLTTETTAYTYEFDWHIGLSPVWFPFVVGLGTILAGWFRLWLDRLRGGVHATTAIASWPLVGLSILGTVLLHSGSGFLPWGHAGWNDLILACGAAGIWFVTDRSQNALIQAACFALLGTVGEIGSVEMGLHRYGAGADHLWGVATWLPSIYFAAAVASGNLARKLS